MSKKGVDNTPEILHDTSIRLSLGFGMNNLFGKEGWEIQNLQINGSQRFVGCKANLLKKLIAPILKKEGTLHGNSKTQLDADLRNYFSQVTAPCLCMIQENDAMLAKHLLVHLCRVNRLKLMISILILPGRRKKRRGVVLAAPVRIPPITASMKKLEKSIILTRPGREKSLPMQQCHSPETNWTEYRFA